MFCFEGLAFTHVYFAEPYTPIIYDMITCLLLFYYIPYMSFITHVIIYDLLASPFG